MFKIIAHGNQPERRTINGLLGGRINHHKRFWYSFDYKDKAHVLISCKNYKQRLKNLYNVKPSEYSKENYKLCPENLCTN